MPWLGAGLRVSLQEDWDECSCWVLQRRDQPEPAAKATGGEAAAQAEAQPAGGEAEDAAETSPPPEVEEGGGDEVDDADI